MIGHAGRGESETDPPGEKERMMNDDPMKRLADLGQEYDADMRRARRKRLIHDPDPAAAERAENNRRRAQDPSRRWVSTSTRSPSRSICRSCPRWSVRRLDGWWDDVPRALVH